jgi:hypothetical protein
MEKPRFRLGKIIGTAAAVKTMAEAGIDPQGLIQRHARGDWGEVSEDVQLANEQSARTTFTTNRPRIFSSYTLGTGKTIWVYTEADRSVTTFLLPEEYHLSGTQAVGPMLSLDGGATRDLQGG